MRLRKGFHMVKAGKGYKTIIKVPKKIFFPVAKIFGCQPCRLLKA